MEPLALTPRDMARALAVLGPTLGLWQSVIREAAQLATRAGDAYDLALDGPMFDGATIWVGRRHLALLVKALDTFEQDVPLPELSVRMEALNPVRGSIAWLEDGA